MRKRIPYIAAFVWLLVILALVVADSSLWSNERRISSFHDGCVAGNKVYVTENIDGEGVLYVSDLSGKVEEVFLSSSVHPGSMFGKVDYQDGLYGVLVSTDAEYRIVQFDDQIRPVAVSPGLHMAQEGILTGFSTETGGFYLTMVSDGGEKACVYFVDRQELIELSEETSQAEAPPALEVKLYELASCEKGRLFVEARYEEGKLLTRRDDGGAEFFQPSPEVQNAFQSRNLTVGQLIKLRQERFIGYIQILLIGYVALFLILIMLRNRSHVVYTIVIVEAVLLAITAGGAVQIPLIREKAEEQEAEWFGFYYVQTLAESIGNPVNYNVEEEGFYDSKEYYSLRNQLCRFVEKKEISQIFADICIVRSSDHQVLVSASGYNGQQFEEVYGAGTRDMLNTLAEGGQKSGTVVRIDGEAYRVLGVPATDGLYPEYLLIGITRREDLSVWKVGSKVYIKYAEILFLLGSMVSISLLVLQGRELKRLAKAMENVANGQMDVEKKSVHGKDADRMWNSLLEIKKTISQINYSKYRIYESCYRFAPKNIEKILGKDSIAEVKSGDMVPVHGTVASISSTELENRDRQSAQVMSRFFKLIEKHQNAEAGFIVSGHSDLTMLKVLYLEDSKSTVDFAAAFMHELCEDRSLEGLKTSVFLHYAQYVYGVAGTEQQSFPFLLSREGKEIEQYARWFQEMGLKLVITESVKNRENPDGNLRYIGYILISDTGEELRLYEALDACPIAQRRLKVETDAKFQKALQLFYQHDFYLARSTFSDVLRENPEDAMAKWYLFTCEKYLNQVHMEGDVCRLYWEA